MKTFTLIFFLLAFGLHLNAQQQDPAPLSTEDKVKAQLDKLEQKIDDFDAEQFSTQVQDYVDTHKPTKEDFEAFKIEGKEIIEELRSMDYSNMDKVKENFEYQFEDLGDILRDITKDFESFIEELELTDSKSPSPTKQI